MKRQKHIFVRIVCGLVLTAVLAAGITWAVRRDRAMHAALRELQEWNQADTVFTSDSAAQVLADYFDHPWHNANDQMLAYYLLGRAHADMGEAPQAIEDYQTAVECADTTDQDCDFRLLRNVYGQMAEVFDAQNLPEDELEAQKKFNHYSWVIGDTLQAIMGEAGLMKPYFLLYDTINMLRVTNEAKKMFIQYGYRDMAALTNIGIIDIHIARNEFNQAKESIEEVRKWSGIFDENGDLSPGREMFYYTLGTYFDSVNQLDSAEYYYRRVLAAGEFEAGYKGLLSVYSKRGIADSIAKFAPLYADANDAMHSEMNSAEVHKTASLYNYNRHMRQAQKERQEKQHLKNILLLVMAIVLMIGVIVYQAYRREKEEQRRLARDYYHAKEELEETRKEIEILREAADQWAGKEAMMKAKEHKLHTLQQQVIFLSSKLKESDIPNASSQESLSETIHHFHSISHPSSIIIDGQKSKHIQPRAAKAHEWKALIEQVRIHYPRFYLYITTEHSLSTQEYRISLLSRLQFETSEMSTLLDTSSSTVSNARKRIAAKLFHVESAADLDAKLLELQ